MAAPLAAPRTADPLGRAEVRVEVRPPWVFRLPGGTLDGVQRRRGGVIERAVHVDGVPAAVRVAQPAPDRVVFGARAPTEAVAATAIERMRFAVGVDDDLRPFYEAFRDDPLIGPSLRERPWLRPRRRPEPYEALLAAVTEQLIELERAAAIQRRIIWRHGRRAPAWDGAGELRDLPDPATVAGIAPAQLQAYDLAAARAITLVRASRAVARGRLDLRAGDPEPGWRLLRSIPGIGSWTIAVLALHGQGRHDVLPSGDLGYLKLVGRLRSGGDPHARATETEVNELFAPYGRWKGLAGTHALVGAGMLAA